MDFDVCKDRVISIVKKNSEHKPEDLGTVGVDTTLKYLGIDSIAFVKIIVDLEGEFNVLFEDHKLMREDFINISSFIEYIVFLKNKHLK